jgi:hypothetical protein
MKYHIIDLAEREEDSSDEIAKETKAVLLPALI